MSGIVTQSRSSNPVVNNYLIRRGQDNYIPYGEGSPYGGNPIMAMPDVQETTSYRSKRGEMDEQEITEADLRVTRNGFTTSDPQFDHGHEFLTTRTSTRPSHPYWEAWDQYAAWNDPHPTGWKGPLIVCDQNGQLPSAPPLRRLSHDDIVSYGQRAVNGSAPTTPRAHLTTMLGEILHDGGLPYVGSQIKNDVKRSHGINPFTGASSDWLNANFGWLPLAKDVKDLIKSLKTANAGIKQLVRDSGRNVRRRFSFPEIVENSTQQWVNTPQAWYNMPGDATFYDIPTGQWRLTKLSSYRRNIWFRGCFTYYMPTDNSLLSRLSRYEQLGNKLLGSRLDASALWELAPWSWLVDWQSDIGNFLQAASELSEDGLVMRYGYLMCHTVEQDIFTTQGLGFKSGGLVNSNTIYRRETKERVRATPYGFGLDLQALNLKQWSILAALGMTRGSNALKLTS